MCLLPFALVQVVLVD